MWTLKLLDILTAWGRGNNQEGHDYMQERVQEGVRLS